MKKLANVDVNKLDLVMHNQLERVIKVPDYNVEKMEKVSPAAVGLCQYTLNVHARNQTWQSS